MEPSSSQDKHLQDLIQQILDHRKNHNLPEALKLTELAISGRMQPSKPTALYARVLHLKAQIHRDLGELDKSFNHYYNAYKIFSSVDDKLSAFHSLWHAGSVESDDGQHEEAKSIFRKCLALSLDLDLGDLHRANFFRVLALHEERIDNLIGAYAFWNTCLTLYGNLDITEGISEAEEKLKEIISRLSL